MKTELSKTAENAIVKILEDNDKLKTIVIILVILALIFAIGKAMRVVSMTVSEYKQLMRVIES